MRHYWLLIIGMIAGLGLGLMVSFVVVAGNPETEHGELLPIGEGKLFAAEYNARYWQERALASENKTPEVVIVDRWHEPEIVTVNVTTIKEVGVEKIIYESRTDWRFFETLPEFTAWIEGKLVLLMPPADCDDYTERLQIAAYKDGYILSAQLIDKDGYLFGKKVMDGTGFHDMIRVNIGNEIFVVEPQIDKFRIIKVGNRD